MSNFNWIFIEIPAEFVKKIFKNNFFDQKISNLIIKKLMEMKSSVVICILGITFDEFRSNFNWIFIEIPAELVKKIFKNYFFWSKN